MKDIHESTLKYYMLERAALDASPVRNFYFLKSQEI